MTHILRLVNTNSAKRFRDRVALCANIAEDTTQVVIASAVIVKGNSRGYPPPRGSGGLVVIKVTPRTEV